MSVPPGFAEANEPISGITDLMRGKLPTLDEALAQGREGLALVRAEYAKLINPLEERIRQFGPPLAEHERKYVDGIHAQISQLHRDRQRAEKPILDAVASIAAVYPNPSIIISRALGPNEARDGTSA